MTDHDAIAAMLDACWWPIARLGDALDVLVRRAGLIATGATAAETPPALLATASRREIARWLDWAATRLEVEAVAVETPAASLTQMLVAAAPAIVLQDRDGAAGFLALAGRRGNAPLLLDSDGRPRSVGVETLRGLLAAPLEAPLRPEIDRILTVADVAPGRRPAVAAAMLAERLASHRIGGAYLLRLPASAPVGRQLAQAGAWRTLTGVLAVFSAGYLLELTGWAVIGSGALGGRLDFGWLTAWVLILLTAVLVRAGGEWLEASFALSVGRVIKARLLAGALQLRPDAIKRSGVGHLIGRVIESQALESLSFSGGLAAVTALLELTLAGWVLSRGATPTAHLVLLALWIGGGVAAGWRYARRLARWSMARLGLTNDLIEAMVGHRTRLAQERPDRRAAADDGALHEYLNASAEMDHAGLVGISTLPSAWMLAGIAVMIPTVAAGPPDTTALAISLGGLFLAQRGFSGIAGGLASLARAGVAWGQVRSIFTAARPAAPSGTFQRREGALVPTGHLLEASGLQFRYPGNDRAVIDRTDLTIDRGDRILLEGASGGGKSTLAALLTGLEQPSAGLMLLDGLDRPTLGSEWHRLAAAAPQFHDNHVLSATLGFNLLLGRSWPPADADLAEALALCEALGLGDLLARMPGGINQRIGETGWQLSHGERSRLFLARALLQDAELVVMDESFAALDPETLRRCLRAATERAGTLMVIAHP